MLVTSSEIERLFPAAFAVGEQSLREKEWALLGFVIAKEDWLKGKDRLCLDVPDPGYIRITYTNDGSDKWSRTCDRWWCEKVFNALEEKGDV